MNLELLKQVMPVVVDVTLTVTIPIVAFAVKAWLNQKVDEKERYKFQDIVEMVYVVVEGIAKKTPGKIDDKLAEGLKQVAEQLGRPTTQEEQTLARALFAKEAVLDKRGV